MLIKLALTIGLSTFMSSSTDLFECEVAPLEEYGFEQIGDHPEYVCANPNDYTDFIIIEDEALLNKVPLNIGDTMKVELKNDEVVNQYRVKSLNSF